MSPDLASRYQRNLALMASLRFYEEELDYGVLDRHLPFLAQLDAVGSSAISVFDLHRREHVYTSPRYLQRLGLIEGGEAGPVAGGLDPLMHPDDLAMSLDAGHHWMQLALRLPPERLREIKVIHDYRLRRSAAEWTRVVEQYLLLELDPRGTMWLTLSIVDVSPDQDLQAPFRASLVDARTGEVTAFGGRAGPLAGDLSEREREVLGLVALGMLSKEIAEALYLSVHTVNTHRQNILRKTGAQNSAGAIRYALDHGLI